MSAFEIEERVVVCGELGQNPSVGRLDGGDLLALHTDTGDCMAGCRLTLRRSRDGGRTWSAPELTIASSLPNGGVEGRVSCLGDLALIAYGEGRDLKRHPENPMRAFVRRSLDGGATWSEPAPLGDEARNSMPMKAIRLRGRRRVLLSAFSWDGAWLDYGEGREWISLFASDDEGESWRRLGTMEKDPACRGLGVSEPSIVELPDGRLLCVMRGNARGSGAFPYGLRSISEDGGATWTPARPIDVNICEPDLFLGEDGRLFLAARSWPGNVEFFYRALADDEREPGSRQTVTVAAREIDEPRSPVTDWGVVVFVADDDGETWRPVLALENPRGDEAMDDADLLRRHRYQAAFPGVAPVGDGRWFVIFRQPDPAMPDPRPGLTYSHLYRRFVAGNIIRRIDRDS